MVFIAILTTWIVSPAYYITMVSISTDIIDGTCIPWVIYTSYALQKTMMSLSTVVMYLLPLTAMLFCYSRIVYTLRY